MPGVRSLIEIVGLGSIVAAAFLIAVPLGLTVLGVALLVVSYGVGR